MNRLVALVVAALFASPLLVACASSDTPEQKAGMGKYQQKMTEAEAKKLMADLDQAGPVCRRGVTDCSYSTPDANGVVVFEALVDCYATDACYLLQAGSGCP